MSVDKLKQALEGLELDFNLDDLHIMPKADFNYFGRWVYKAEAEEIKVKSQKIGQELLLKELKEDLGLDYESRKNPEKLKEAYKEKFGASTDDSAAEISALQNKFTKELELKNEEINSIKSTYQAESDNKTIDEHLRKSFSTFDGKTAYSTEDLITIAKAKGNFKVVDGNVYQAKDGEVVKNDLLSPVTSDSFVDSMMKGGYISEVKGGKILGDETKGGKYSLEEFIAAQAAQGINENGMEFANNLATAQANGTIEL